MSKKRKELAKALKNDSKATFDAIADAEKKGYLPEIKLFHLDHKLIENRLATLEERIQFRTAERNKEYLHCRQIWGERYAHQDGETFSFGNWNKDICDNYALRASCTDKTLSPEEQLANKQKLTKMMEKTAYLQTSQIREPTDWQLKSSEIVHTNKYNETNGTPLAFIDSKQAIYINDGVLKNSQNCTYKPVAEAASGNPAALQCLVIHELNHKHNWEHDGLGQLSYTPTNAAKGDILTEKISLCTEYLHMTEEYATRKANGDKTIKYDDGTEKPLDTLLDIYPGLKDTVQKYGTDINNSETKKEIVKVAMNYWEEDRGKIYTKQTDRMIQLGQNAFNKCSFSKQMEVLKDEEQTYQKVSTAMLSDINIGSRQIDLKDCRNLIDTVSSEDIKQRISEKNASDTFFNQLIYTPTYQEYQAINNYLESIGKKTDAEKMDHIAKTVQQGVFSFNSHDKALEDIMKSHNKQIIFSATEIEKDNDCVIAIFGYEKNKFDITEYVTKSQENTKQQNQSVAFSSVSRER